jgi:DNA-directed RNA polymerase specialized sigma24 family protein
MGDSVAGLLRGLYPEQRRMMIDYFVDDHSMKEIGRRHHISESRVSQIIGQVLRELRAQYGLKPHVAYVKRGQRSKRQAAIAAA